MKLILQTNENCGCLGQIFVVSSFKIPRRILEEKLPWFETANGIVEEKVKLYNDNLS